MNKSSASLINSNENDSVRESKVVCDTINALTISGADESTGVTNFVQEACEQVEVLGKHYVPSKLTTTQGDLQDLKEYFRRPRVISSAFFTANARGQQFASNVDKINLLTSYFPSGFSRLQGVLGFRFKLVFTLQVSATPFSQGVLALGFQYNTADTSTTNFLRTNYSSTITNLPHVRLDIAESTMVQLTVPFLYQREYLTVNAGDIVTNEWTYGLVSLHRILPIRIGTANTPSYKLYVHLEDLELVGASPETWATVNYQAGKPIEKEFENDAYPMSSSLHAASRAVSWISKGVPSISSIAGPTSWFLGKTAGIIRYFGWSKPLIQEPPVRTMRMDTILENNVDVPSQALMVGPMCSNRLRVDPQFASTDVDEMSLSYVLGQWSQIKYNTVLSTATIGTLVSGVPISPSCFYFNTLVANTAPDLAIDTAGSFIPSNAFYWGSCFRQWKGDLEFRFTFAKTKLHAGRVIVYYTPSNIAASQLAPGVSVALKGPDVTTTPHPFGYSAIFDLKDTNVFTFKVPFVSDTPYKDFWGATGTLNMYVMDPISITTTISNTIDVLTEVRCMPNFELSIPVGNPFPAVVQSTPVYQAGDMITTIAENASEMVVGEQITSVKQLIAIPGNVVSPNEVQAVGVRAYTLWPWWSCGSAANTSPGPAYSSLDPTFWTLSAYAARAYNYARGSTDFHIYNPPGSTVTKDVYQHSGAGSVSLASSVVPYSLNNSPRVTTSHNSLHVRCPAYGRTARYLAGSLYGILFGTPSISTSDTVPFQFARLYMSNVGANPTTVKVFRAAGDDAMLGHYMGPVPLSTQLATSTNADWDLYTRTYQSSKEVYHQRTGTAVVDDYEEINGEKVPINFGTIQYYNNNKEVAPPPTPSRSRSFRPPSPFKVSGDVGVKPDNLSGKLTSLLQRAELLPKYANLTAQVAEVVSNALDQQ